MSWGDVAKSIINFGEDVMAGVSGNTKRYAATLGKRALKSNMSAQQLRAGMEGALKGEAAQKFKDASQKAVANYMKNNKGATLKQAQKAMHKADFTGIGDQLLVNAHKNKQLGYKLGDALGGGFRDAAKTLKNGKGFSNALKAGFTKTGADGKMQVRAGRVAGAVVTAGVAGRVASGGGLYRDRYGRVNVPGVPFI